MQKNPFYYIGANPTVDLVIFNDLDEVLLVRRKDEEGVTERAKWACPGGFVNGKKNTDNTFIPTESIEQAAVRETKEETNSDVKPEDIIFVGIFEGNGRDPRDNPISWSKSHAFTCHVIKEEYMQKNSLEAMDDVDGVQWIHLSHLKDYPIAFDHEKIIAQAQSKFLKKLKI